MFESKRLPPDPDALAPDGSDVRILLGTERGGMAHFEFAAGATAPAVRHSTVDEVWYVVSGEGEMWLASDDGSEVVRLAPGTCISIPVGVAFQVRNAGEGPLGVIGATMPPWPGDGEATIVAGKWEPTLEPGPH